MNKLTGRILILIVFLSTPLFNLSGSKIEGHHGREILLKDYLEETHLYTDRDIYIAGEKLWFSTFISCVQDTSLQCLSHVLYVELYHDSEPYILQQKFRIVNGRVSASLIIPDDFLTGNYYLQAYTNYQKSSLPVDLTRKEILILNPKRKLKVPADEKKAQLFFKKGFPLYGRLSSGVLAVNGRSDKVQSAFLIDNLSDTVCKINWLKDKLGNFHFTPKKGIKYTAKIVFENGDTLGLPVNNINSSGIELNVKPELSVLSVSVEPINLIDDSPGELLIKDRLMNVLYKKELSSLMDAGTIKVDNRLLSDDINYIVLKGKHNELLGMQLLFPSRKNAVRINLKTDLPYYKPGDNVRLTIDNTDDLAFANVNVAVSVVLKGSETTYNLAENQNKLDEATSILRENAIFSNQKMLNKLIANESGFPVENIPDIRDVSLTGTLTDVSDKPLANTDVYLSVLGDEPQLHIYKTNEDGSFVFSLNNFHGNRKIFTGTNNTDPVKIKINNDFADRFYPEWNALYFERNKKKLYNQLFINKQVTDYYLQMNNQVKPDDFLPQPVFSDPDYRVRPADFIPLKSLEEIFKEIVPNVFVIRNKGIPHFEIKVNDQDRMIKDPLVMLNNIPVFNYSELLNIHPSLIDKVAVINQEYFIGSHMFNGVVNLTANKSALEEYKFPEGTVFFNYQTLNPRESFIIPREKQIVDNSHPLPWFANLMYWNTEIYQSQHSVTKSFVSGDNEGEYVVQVKGIAKDGTPVYGYTTFIVKNQK